MAIATAVSLVEALRQFRLLEPAQVQEVDRLRKRLPEPRQLAKELLKRGWLTSYQVNQVLTGRGSALVLGPYLLLEKLGEGGYGQVFKARHQSMKRIVALKVLRQELLGDAEAVSRFHREMEAASQIAHPNIVHALDAGPLQLPSPLTGSLVATGGEVRGYFLAMEFVDGVGLDRLVQDSGPLPVARAVNYVLQAAMGLQHAHERGLIHRDIKPANLLLAKAHGAPSVGLIKILDLGLARLQQPAPGSPTSNLTILSDNSITQGTPDYMAPEQALDFHSADARSDIYSLGCTFYYLLTGWPPFPGGTLAEKLMQHQEAEPPAVDKLRTDLPAGLPAILRKMLAKKPKDRYQNLAEFIQALAPYEGEAKETKKLPKQDTVFGEEARGRGVLTGTPAPQQSAARKPQDPAKNAGRRLAFRLVVAVVLAAPCLLAFLVFSKSSTQTSQKPSQDSLGTGSVSTSNSAPASSNWVTVASVSSGRPYDTATATVGVVYWIDRQYKITVLSAALDGGLLIRGANDDKNVNNPVHLTFTLTIPAMVYVAYDKRGKQLPAWLTDGTWQLTSEALSASGGDVQASPMKVYSKPFAAGRVTLGGNKQAPAAGAGSNYVVIVKPSS